MGGLSSYRSALLVGGMLAAGLVGASFASAQEGPPVPVSFEDPGASLAIQPGLDVSIRDNPDQRFAPIDSQQTSDGERPRRLELELAAGGGSAPVDVSVAQRASIGSDDNADSRGTGSEVRIGRGLVRDERNSGGNQGRSVYMFVASDNEALTWQPGARNDFGGRSASLALEDRVEIGDMSAGVTYERNGIQASLAYVEREESTQIGTQSFNQDTSFTGVTITMRR
jgi:hypothetical protein